MIAFFVDCVPPKTSHHRAIARALLDAETESVRSGDVMVLTSAMALHLIATPDHDDRVYVRVVAVQTDPTGAKALVVQIATPPAPTAAPQEDDHVDR